MNEESILQVSPTDGLTSLTLPQSGPGEGPERFYPSGARNFLRLVPPDSAQAGPLVAVARERGAERLALAHDGGIFGKQLAGAVEQAAVDKGLEVTTVERVQPDLDEAPALARHLADDEPGRGRLPRDRRRPRRDGPRGDGDPGPGRPSAARRGPLEHAGRPPAGRAGGAR